MAKEKRFPSPANVKPDAPAEKAPEVKESISVGKKQDLVQVEYKKENHHVFHGVHAVKQGLNHLPKSVWEEAKKHPTVVQMIKDGHLVEINEEASA